jgi:hypothetical protein
MLPWGDTVAPETAQPTLLDPLNMEQTVFSKTLAYKIHMPGNYPAGKHKTFRTQ